MKTIIRSHKIRLRPTEDQKEHLQRAFAAARHAWNWGKEVLDAEYDYNRQLYNSSIGENHPFIRINAANKETGQRSLKMWYNQVKPDWIKDKTASATQEAFADLQRAIQRYFDIRKGKVKIDLKRDKGGNIKPRKDGRHHGWLTWRSKKKHNSFRVTNVYLKFDGPYIRYNANVGYIRMCETLRFEGKIMNATFSFDGEWYWASVQVKSPKPDCKPSPGVIGIDLGIRYLAVTSDGDNIENPKAYYAAQAKLRRLNRKLDRQRRANNPDCFNPDKTAIKGKRPNRKSKRMEETEAQIKKLHKRIRNIRNDRQHQLTAKVCKNYGLIILEDLNVRGMMKNRNLAKSIADAGFSEIRRQFEYKSDWHGGTVGVVDRWFPSSKLCSGCNTINFYLPQGATEWTCGNCGQHNHRDENAAINLKNEGLRIFVNPDIIQPGAPWWCSLIHNLLALAR